MRWLMLMLALTACGGHGHCPPESVRALSPAERDTYRAVMECAGMSAPEPGIADAKEGACHPSGKVCCFEDARRLTGRYWPDCGVIRLPRDPAPECSDAFPHEAIHHLLHYNTGDSDAGHERVEWGCA